MANQFPAVPSDMLLAQLNYTALLPGVTIQPGSALDYGSEVNGQLVYTVPELGASFNFVTPGTFGTFDQQAFEAELSQSVTAVCQVLSGMSGEALTTVQSQVQIFRTWTWTDGDGFRLAYQDQMTYP